MRIPDRRRFLKLITFVQITLSAVCLRAQDRMLPNLPEAQTPVTLSAVTDAATGKSQFSYQGPLLSRFGWIAVGKISGADSRICLCGGTLRAAAAVLSA